MATGRHETAITACLLHLRDVPVAGQEVSHSAEYRRSHVQRITCPNPATTLNQFAQLQNLIRLCDVFCAQLQRVLDFGPLIFAQDLRHFKIQNVGAQQSRLLRFDRCDDDLKSVGLFLNRRLRLIIKRTCIDPTLTVATDMIAI